MGEQMAIDLLTPFTKVELKAKEDEKRRAIGLFFGVILILFMLAI